jgi:hypothetical protein
VEPLGIWSWAMDWPGANTNDSPGGACNITIKAAPARGMGSPCRLLVARPMDEEKDAPSFVSLARQETMGHRTIPPMNAYSLQGASCLSSWWRTRPYRTVLSFRNGRTFHVVVFFTYEGSGGSYGNRGRSWYMMRRIYCTPRARSSRRATYCLCASSFAAANAFSKVRAWAL